MLQAEQDQGSDGLGRGWLHRQAVQVQRDPRHRQGKETRVHTQAHIRGFPEEVKIHLNLPTQENRLVANDMQICICLV